MYEKRFRDKKNGSFIEGEINFNVLKLFYDYCCIYPLSLRVHRLYDMRNELRAS